MIEFKPITIDDKELYNSFLFGSGHGCERSFGNIFMWGHHEMAILNGDLVMLSQYGKWQSYPFPVGSGNKKDSIDAIITDAKERNIPLRISGINNEERDILESLYPGMFNITANRNSSDYVYDINDLADLKGRKYHRKRNHIHRFKDQYPAYRVEVISSENLAAVRKMADSWYEDKIAENPEEDFKSERGALSRALDNYEVLELEGLAIFIEDDIVAFTSGSRMGEDTFDVHFEKARKDINGAYGIINNEYAKYIRDKYPEVSFLDREEDMGIEGLRKAKESYFPHHMIEKSVAVPKEQTNED